MSDEIAIRVENLSKRYRIGAKEEVQDTLAGVLTDWVKRPGHNLRRLRDLTRFSDNGQQEPDDIVWALKDVSFEVKRGEVVGIIGRNGAGKSTLLKILSRITHPTTGRVEINGRVSSLLEVGTGFHPELTGRENIYLNGTILGMRKSEIDRKFDEIVDFSGIERFIDTPVKRYSSGMRVRLAFSVAAHLEPENLLVDEVLAVGDAEFQKRCLGKIEDVAARGRTVLFVSHSMPMILRFCERAVLLDSGRKIAFGVTRRVVRTYLQSSKESPTMRSWEYPSDAPGDNCVRLKSVRILTLDGQIADTFDIRSPLFVEVQYWNLREGIRPTAIIHFVNEQGITLFASNDWNNRDWWETPRSKSVVTAICKVPGNFLAEGTIFLLVAVNSYNPDVNHVLERDIIAFQVVERGTGDSVRGEYAGDDWPGVVRPMLEWAIKVRAISTDE